MWNYKLLSRLISYELGIIIFFKISLFTLNTKNSFSFEKKLIPKNCKSLNLSWFCFQISAICPFVYIWKFGILICIFTYICKWKKKHHTYGRNISVPFKLWIRTVGKTISNLTYFILISNEPAIFSVLTYFLCQLHLLDHSESYST